MMAFIEALPYQFKLKVLTALGLAVMAVIIAWGAWRVYRDCFSASSGERFDSLWHPYSQQDAQADWQEVQQEVA